VAILAITVLITDALAIPTATQQVHPRLELNCGGILLADVTKRFTK